MFSVPFPAVPYPPSVSAHKVDHQSLGISWTTDDWDNPYYPAENALQYKLRYSIHGSKEWIEVSKIVSSLRIAQSILFLIFKHIIHHLISP